MEWISCEDQLPKVGSMVLATDGNVVTIVQLISLSNFKKLVTHWMPLPEPPMN